MTKKVRTYSDEFKAEAVKKIADNRPLAKVAEDFTITNTFTTG